jgi:hypothetical protein
MERKVGGKARPVRKGAPCPSPYDPPKSILKQQTKAKLVQFKAEDPPKVKQISKPRKPKTDPKKRSKKEVEDFFAYLTQPSHKSRIPEPTKSKYSVTHQVYHFETSSKFGKPYEAADFAPEAENQADGPMSAYASSIMLSSSTDEDSNEGSGELDRSLRFPVDEFEDEEGEEGPPPTEIDEYELQRRSDTLGWERIMEIEAQHNLVREKEMEKQSRGESGPARRKTHFKSTYTLLVPKTLENDKLVDLNIIVRR